MTPVFFLCNKLHAGGAEKQLLLTVKALSELGVPCIIRCLSNSEPAESLKPLAYEIDRLFNVRPYQFRLRELIQLGRVPHVYWSWGRRADMILKFWMPALRGRLFCSLRDADLEKMRKYRLFERAFHSRVHRYVSNSYRACKELSSIVPRVNERSTILLNALPGLPEHVSPPWRGSTLSVAMLGNILVYKKGYDIVLDLAELIRKRNAQIEIHVAGRDESAGEFQRIINERNLAAVIKYTGPSTRPLDFLARHHAFLLLSRYEAVPNALLEAMSIGLPCISTKVGDVPLLFRDKEHLLLLAEADAGQAFDAILRLQADWNSAAERATRARRFCSERFCFARLKSDVAELFSLQKPQLELEPNASGFVAGRAEVPSR